MPAATSHNTACTCAMAVAHCLKLRTLGASDSPGPLPICLAPAACAQNAAIVAIGLAALPFDGDQRKPLNQFRLGEREACKILEADRRILENYIPSSSKGLLSTSMLVYQIVPGRHMYCTYNIVMLDVVSYQHIHSRDTNIENSITWSFLCLTHPKWKRNVTRATRSGPSALLGSTAPLRC